jgi:threonine dehydrogenase-like Zn-dependent dehydrogenase
VGGHYKLSQGRHDLDPGRLCRLGDKIPLGAAMNKGLTFKMGQTHVQKYTKPLLEKIEACEIDPSFVVTHPAKLEDAPAMYKKFRDKETASSRSCCAPRNEPKPT